MGREAVCHARFGRDSGEGKALLETEEVIFRGEFRVKVPLRSLRNISVRAGVLTLAWPEGRLALTLGAAADKWAEAIRNPRSVLEKLGLKAGLRVVLSGRFAPGFAADLARVLGSRPLTRAVRGSDLVFASLARPADHTRLEKLIPAIAPDGGIWAVYPRGDRALSEDTIRAAARAAGLVDIKVVRFSDTHGALKLVLPREARGATRARSRAAAGASRPRTRRS